MSFHPELRVVLQYVEVERDEEFRASKRTTGVAGLAGMNHANDIATNLSAEFLELVEIRLSHFEVFARMCCANIRGGCACSKFRTHRLRNRLSVAEADADADIIMPKVCIWI